MVPLCAGTDQPAGQREALTTSQLGHPNLKGQHRGDQAQRPHHLARAAGAKNGERFRSTGISDRVQESRQPRNMVSVRMGNADCSEAPETPSGTPPGDLSALAAIEERLLPFDPDEKTGEPAARQRHHPAGAQQDGFDHQARSGKSEIGMEQA